MTHRYAIMAGTTICLFHKASQAPHQPKPKALETSNKLVFGAPSVIHDLLPLFLMLHVKSGFAKTIRDRGHNLQNNNNNNILNIGFDTRGTFRSHTRP